MSLLSAPTLKDPVKLDLVPETFGICGVQYLKSAILEMDPDIVVSISDPEFGSSADHQLKEYSGTVFRLAFHDVDRIIERHTAPSIRTFEPLLTEFLSRDPGSKVLVHCQMGISRSPAVAALLMAAAHQRDRIGVEASLVEIEATLKKLSPHATPNLRIMGIAGAIYRDYGRTLQKLGEKLRDQSSKY